MSRRRLIAILSAVLLLGVLVAVALVAVSLTQTSFGREKVRSLLESRIRATALGKWHIGKLSGGLLTGFELDSLEIRDVNDSLFIAAGRVSVEYDIRDILDRRILLKRVELHRPTVNLTKYGPRDWVFDRLFRKARITSPVALDRGYGDFVRADTLVLLGGTITLTEPWRPDTSLSPARREQVLQSYLNDPALDIVPVGDGYARVRRFSNVDLQTMVRWAQPDSAGRFFDITKMDVVSSDPPLDVRNLRGTVLVVADSVWVNTHHIQLAASVGRLSGKITSGGGLPTRYEGSIVADTLALADINWIYKPLPTEGWARVQVDVRNNPDNLKLMEYTLSEMDMHTTGSIMRGGMTFGVGDTVLRITDVNLRAMPLDFRLIEEFGENPFPVPWNGQFNGTVRATGGPVNRFMVQDMSFTFLDGNVPLAITSGTGRGELDVTQPSETIFRGFDVDFTRIDLRTMEFLFPAFPRHGGSASGRARLDSLWHDVRFSNADFLLSRGSAPPSNFLGSGRVTVAEPSMIFDLDLIAQPLSFSAFAEAFPAFPLRGQMSGPFVMRGSMDALEVRTDLTGAAGALSWNGVVDYSLPTYGARGIAALRALNLRALFDRDDLPATVLNAVISTDIQGDSLASLLGALDYRGTASQVENMRMSGAHASLRFGGGRMYVDSVNIASEVGTFVAGRGAIGLSAAVNDSVPVHLELPSLQNAVGFANALGGIMGNPTTLPTTLAGTVVADGVLTGSLRSLGMIGTVQGSTLALGENTVKSISGHVHFVRMFSNTRSGTVTLSADSAAAASVEWREVAARYSVTDGARSQFHIDGVTYGGARSVVSGSTLARDGTTNIEVDTLRLDLGTNVWNLLSPARITLTGRDYLMQRIELRGSDGARAVLMGSFPYEGEVNVQVEASRVPMSDVERLGKVQTGLEGIAAFEVVLNGTRSAPRLDVVARIDSLGVGSTRLDAVEFSARYAARNLTVQGGLLFRGDRVAQLDLNVPVDLSPDGAGRRFPDEPISGRITANNVSLGIGEAFFPQLRNVTGTVTSNVGVAGTLRSPQLSGAVVIADGGALLPELGIQLRSLNADLGFAGDSLLVRRFSTAYEGGAAGDTLSVNGWVVFSEPTNPEVDLQLFSRDFRAVQLTRVADIYINSELRLFGRYQDAALTGFVNVDRGALYIPELAQKRLVSLHMLDSTLLASRELVTPVPSSLLRNLEFRNVRVLVGDQVWLRSPEASTSIQLGGEVSLASVRTALPGRERSAVTGTTARPAADSVYRLSIEGTLNADRGDYRLDAGVVQRKFQVEQGGTVTFFGEPELNPTLNISAIHSVRRASGQDAGRDIRIRVRITGSLSDYSVEFESVDGLEMSQSDLISYLVTGRPSFELGAAGTEHLRTAFDILLPSLGAFLGDRFAGSRFDLFQLELAPLGESDRLGEGLRDVLKRARVGVGKQIGNRTFISANTNLCRLGGLLEGESSTTEELIQSFGVRLEHSLNHNFSLALSAEPSTAATRCAAAGSSSRGIISSPPQFGFDIFKVWRF